jgi:dissimilatory sulfite reductase (desulfoviridin) alpha/beta subunit
LASGQFELKNGNLFVLAEAAGGVYNGSQLRLICDVADDVSVFLKVTEDQRIGFMVPKDKLLELHGKLSKSGILLKHYRNHSILSPKACLGELCPKCEQDALGDAIEISPILNEKFKDSFTALNIGMNGCAVACVASATDDIHIVGDSKGYKVFVGGRISGEPKLAELAVEGIPRPKIGEAIAIILDAYSQNKQDGESVSDVVSRLGVATFKDAIEKAGLTSPQEASAEELPLEASDVPQAEASEEASQVETSEEDVAAVPLEETPLDADGEKAEPQAEPQVEISEDDVAAVPLEEAPLEVDAAEEAPAVEPPQEEAPLEVDAAEEAPAAEPPQEEAPLEVDAAEEAPAAEPPQEEAPLEVDAAEEAPAAEPPPEEIALSSEDVPSEETPAAEETPEEKNSPIMESKEETPLDEPTESVAAPAEEAQSTESIPTGAESMQEEELAVDEPALSEASGGGEVVPIESKEEEKGVKGSSLEMKELDIIDDTSEESSAQDDHPAPEPIDHGLGEDPSLQGTSEEAPSGGISEDAAPMGLDEDEGSSHISTGNNKISIHVRGSYVTVVLSDGSDFRIPFKTIKEGKTIEMQIEDETFIIENIYGKLQVKYGDFEMHIPLSHGSALEAEEGEAVAA